MKRVLINILIVLGFYKAHSQMMWQIKKDTVTRWYYYDGDEFSGKSVDLEKWRTSYSWTKLNYEFDYLMLPENLVYENGVCHFVCDRDTGWYEVPSWQLDSNFIKKYKLQISDGNKFRYLFTAGNVLSNIKYTKGYFEIRFKTTDSYGMWPAFWLYGKNKDEIDFFELKGERSKDVHIDVHCLKGCDNGYTGGSVLPKSFGGWIKTSAPLNNSYNVFSGEWQDGYVKWYLNGEGIGYYKGEFGSDKMSLLIGTGPAKDGLAFYPGVNEKSVFPNSFDVDYVRVWYKDNQSKEEVKGNKEKQFGYVNSNSQTRSLLKRKINFMYSKKSFRHDLLTVSILPMKDGKYLITSFGKELEYSIEFMDKDGNLLLTKNILATFDEVDLSKFNIKPYFRVSIKYDSQKIEDRILVQ